MADNDNPKENTLDVTPEPTGDSTTTPRPRRVSREVVSMNAEFYSGMLPHPEMCAKMEELAPGFTERLLRMTEEQMAHRQILEKSVIIGGGKRSDRGLYCGLVVVLAFLSVSGWLIHEQHDVAGTILGSVDLVALAGTFIYGRAEQRKEREEKSGERKELRKRVLAQGHERQAKVQAQRGTEEIEEENGQASN